MKVLWVEMEIGIPPPPPRGCEQTENITSRLELRTRSVKIKQEKHDWSQVMMEFVQLLRFASTPMSEFTDILENRPDALNLLTGGNILLIKFCYYVGTTLMPILPTLCICERGNSNTNCYIRSVYVGKKRVLMGFAHLSFSSIGVSVRLSDRSSYS